MHLLDIRRESKVLGDVGVVLRGVISERYKANAEVFWIVEFPGGEDGGTDLLDVFRRRGYVGTLAACGVLNKHEIAVYAPVSTRGPLVEKDGRFDSQEFPLVVSGRDIAIHVHVLKTLLQRVKITHVTQGMVGDGKREVWKSKVWVTTEKAQVVRCLQGCSPKFDYRVCTRERRGLGSTQYCNGQFSAS